MTVFLADEQARPVDLDSLRRLAELVLADRRVPEAMEVSVLCVDADSIAALNARHLGVEGPTDVLAFPIDMPGETSAEEPAILGDVVLCPEVAERQAAEGKDPEHSTPAMELELLLVHGLLHLLGHDHAEPDEQATMFSLTDQLLTRFRSASGPARANAAAEAPGGSST